MVVMSPVRTNPQAEHLPTMSLFHVTPCDYHMVHIRIGPWAIRPLQTVLRTIGFGSPASASVVRLAELLIAIVLVQVPQEVS